jgi:hypothetical protein
VNEKVVSIALAIVLAFTAAVNVYATVKVNGATDKINNMFCVEPK